MSRVMACGPARPAWQAIAPYPNRTRQRCNWKPTATWRQIIPFWEWPKVLAPSASPQGRGLEAHSCHASPSPSLALPLSLYLPISFAPSRLLAGCPSLGSNSGNSPHPAPWSHAVSWERMPPPRGPCTTLAPYAAELAATECHGPCESRAPCGFVQGGRQKVCLWTLKSNFIHKASLRASETLRFRRGRRAATMLPGQPARTHCMRPCSENALLLGRAWL